MYLILFYLITLDFLFKFLEVVQAVPKFLQRSKVTCFTLIDLSLNQPILMGRRSKYHSGCLFKGPYGDVNPELLQEDSTKGEQKPIERTSEASEAHV